MFRAFLHADEPQPVAGAVLSPPELRQVESLAVVGHRELQLARSVREAHLDDLRPGISCAVAERLLRDPVERYFDRRVVPLRLEILRLETDLEPVRPPEFPAEERECDGEPEVVERRRVEMRRVATDLRDHGVDLFLERLNGAACPPQIGPERVLELL